MFTRNTHKTFDVLSQFPLIGGPFVRYFADGDGDDSGEGGGDGGSGDGGGSADPDPKDAQIAKLIKEGTGYHKRAQDAEKRLQALEGNVLSDDDRALFTQLRADKAEADEGKQKAAGQYEELLAQKVEKFDADIATEQAKTTMFQSAFEQVAVLNPLQAELAKAGVTNVDNAAHLIQNKHAHRATAQLVDGKAVVRVVDGQGNPVTDAECDAGQSISIEQLVTGWIATDTGKCFMPPSGDTGSGAHQGGVPGVTIEDLDADFEKKTAFIKEHGRAAYIELSRRKKK